MDYYSPPSLDSITFLGLTSEELFLPQLCSIKLRRIKRKFLNYKANEVNSYQEALFISQVLSTVLSLKRKQVIHSFSAANI